MDGLLSAPRINAGQRHSGQGQAFAGKLVPVPTLTLAPSGCGSFYAFISNYWRKVSPEILMKYLAC